MLHSEVRNVGSKTRLKSTDHSYPKIFMSGDGEMLLSRDSFCRGMGRCCYPGIVFVGGWGWRDECFCSQAQILTGYHL